MYVEKSSQDVAIFDTFNPPRGTLHGARGRSRLSRMANEGALATLDDDAAIAEIASGTLSKEIAQRFGVTPWAVRKRLSKHPDYPQAVRDQAESFIEDAMQDVRTATADTVAIARARGDLAFKYAAGRDPARWGNRPDAGQPSVTINVVRAAGGPVEVTVGSQSVTIDATPVADTPAQHSIPKP